jgi:NitT/TauT family transport system substrate-binding protein
MRSPMRPGAPQWRGRNTMSRMSRRAARGQASRGSRSNRVPCILGMLGILLAPGAGGCGKPAGAASRSGGAAAAHTEVIRVGHFPNVTHAHALVAHNLSRERRAGQGEGWFEKRLGVEVEWLVYNAGPSAMEALLGGAIDLAYVGPNPAINAHLRTKGRDIRVVAGATMGGSALVVRPDRGLRTAADFRGKRIATPQLGNTQDVACRVWLMNHGLRVHQTGGDALVVPTNNPEQLPLFQRGDVDAAWTVEPWVSRLELEARGQVLLAEPDAITTVLVTSVRFLTAHEERVRAFVAAHRELTDWLGQDPPRAMARVADELREETRRGIRPEFLERAWPRMRFVSAVEPAALAALVAAAQRVGFVHGSGDVGALVEAGQ